MGRLSEAGLDQPTQDALAFNNALRFLGHGAGLNAA